MMGYVSQLAPHEVVIDDHNYQQFVADPVIGGEVKTRGKIPRDYDAQPYGSLPFASAVPLPLIPQSEWEDRIREMESTKTRISDLLDQAGLTVLDQNGTNYCWINAPTHCVEILRVVQNQSLVRLSPASVGAKIKNFRNVGGWGTEGLEYIVAHGLVPQSVWPANAISRQYDNAAADAERSKYQVQEWWELKSRNLDELMTCLLMRFPVAVGYNWWSHEVTAIDPVSLGNGKFGIRIDNSWGTGWSDKGRGILSGSKMLPDDAVVPRTATPS